MKQTVTQTNATQTTETRIQALENNQTVLLNAIENLTKVIVNIQTANLQGHSLVTAPVSHAPKQGQKKQVAIVPVVAVTGNDAFESIVLPHTVERVKYNQKHKIFNEKIINQQNAGAVDCPDYRVYLKTSEHKTFKLSYRTAGYTLKQAVEMLADAVGF